jgi:hypothetical protein
LETIMAKEETREDVKPVKTVTISVEDVQKKISNIRTDGKVSLTEPDGNGNVVVTVKATSKGDKDHPHTGRYYPIEAVLTVPEAVVSSPEGKFAFIKAAYSVGLDHSTAYRDTEAGVKPKAMKRAAEALTSEETLRAAGATDEEIRVAAKLSAKLSKVASK